MDARNRHGCSQSRHAGSKNGAIEGSRPVVEVSHHFGEDTNPDRNRRQVKSGTQFRIGEKRDPDSY
jgi:hypothetical protein